MGHAVAQMVEALRYKTESSIPDGVIGNFYRHNPSGCNATLTDMSARNISWEIKAAGA
jgi:hypothetical protein